MQLFLKKKECGEFNIYIYTCNYEYNYNKIFFHHDKTRAFYSQPGKKKTALESVKQ
jgi:hypothetical protein